MKIFAVVVLALSLVGCQTVDKVQIAPPSPLHVQGIDTSLLKKCNLPVQLPKRMLTQAEVEHYWSIDRKNLIICAKRHGYLGDAIQYRDAQIEALTPPNIKKK
jgi:hypothetical protein